MIRKLIAPILLAGLVLGSSQLLMPHKAYAGGLEIEVNASASASAEVSIGGDNHCDP